MAAIDRINAPQHGHPSWWKAGIAAGMGAALIASAPLSWGQPAGSSPLNALHQALHLSAPQEAAWQVYSANVSAPGRAQDRRRAASLMFPNLNAPQRMDLVEAEMKQELADLQQQSQALRAFYITLSPEQKSAFDAQTLPQQPGQ